MPRSTSTDQVALAATLRRQRNVIARKQAFACGLTGNAITHRLRPGGPWQCLLPAVYLAETGTPTLEQRELAALLYAGPGSVITGAAALQNQGIITQPPAIIDVLVPADRKLGSKAFVAIHRTRRMPDRVLGEGQRRYALPPRALADAARGLNDLAEVRAVVISAIQKSQCPVELLAREIRLGPVRDSARLRRVVTEARAGVRSIVEAEFRDLIRRARLPEPLYNPDLYTVDGNFIARPDTWWPEHGVAAEVDSREFHLSPAGWERTQRRHEAMTRHGIFVLHFSPRRIRTDRSAVVASIKDALRAGAQRPPLPVVTRPAA
jgi:hypothetical protein